MNLDYPYHDVSVIELTLEKLKYNYSIPDQCLTLHERDRQTIMAMEAAVYTLTNDSVGTEYETVEKTFEASLDKVGEITTKEPASWWQHFKKDCGWEYKTKDVVHKVQINTTGPVTSKFQVPVKKVYKKVFLGLPPRGLNYRVLNMWPVSDFEKSEEYWVSTMLRNPEYRDYIAPSTFKSKKYNERN